MDVATPLFTLPHPLTHTVTVSCSLIAQVVGTTAVMDSTDMSEQEVTVVFMTLDIRLMILVVEDLT